MIEKYTRKSALWVSIRLPPCPGVNALYRAFVRPGARYATNIKSERYREWIKVAGTALEAQNPCCVTGSYGLRLSVPAKGRGDLDGYLKATIDLLVRHGVVEGDGPKHLQRLEVWRGNDSDMEISIISTKSKGE